MKRVGTITQELISSSAKLGDYNSAKNIVSRKLTWIL